MSAARAFLAARRRGGAGGRGAPGPVSSSSPPATPRPALFQLHSRDISSTRPSYSLLRACLGFRQRRWEQQHQQHRPGAAVAAAAASRDQTTLASPSASPPNLDAIRLAASAGLQRGLRTAAAAAASSAAAESNSSSSLEGRLLRASLVAAPSPSSPFLLRLMEQRFRLRGDGANDDDNTDPVITVITPHDVDAIFDALQARGSDDGDPYWARVWPSAVALAECLLGRPELVRGRRVADVGAGLGVAGIAAALAGAREVVLLDREPLALECARLSAEATAVAAAGRGRPAFAVSPEPLVPVVGDGAGELTSAHEVLGLQSDTPAAPNASTAANTVLRCERFDWHQRPLPAALRQAFDVVLACDVLYERDAVEPLAEVVSLLLAKSSRIGGGNGRLLLLADPPARTAQHREQFLSLLAAASGGGVRFVVDESSVEQCAPRQLDRELLGGDAEGKPVSVQLLHLRAAEGNDTVGLKL